MIPRLNAQSMPTMKLITKQQLIATAAQRYRTAHTVRDQWLDLPDIQRKKAVYAALCELPSNADEAQITAIVGSDRLTRNVCHECGCDSEVTVGLGSEIHHAIDTRYICTGCLERALSLAEANTNRTNTT